MADFQKVLQIFRTDPTHVWSTKNIAKAEVERHAKGLHPELGLRADLRDGEQIAARYYDKVARTTYQYVDYVPTSGDPADPYAIATSANHVWVDNFDSFATSPDPATVGYDSAAYIRVGSTGNWSYYKLNVTLSPETPTLTDTNGISTVIGVAYNYDSTMYIEWFDSAAEAQAAVKNLNYKDTDLSQGFVSAVHQKEGKIISLHGNITGDEAIHITDSAYRYVNVGTSDPNPAGNDWTWDSSNTKQSVPTTGLNENSSKYIRVPSGSVEPITYTYYELRKNIEVDLFISDNTNNILKQGNTQTYSWTTLDEPPAGADAQVWVDGFNSGNALPTASINSPRYYRVQTGSTYTYHQLTITNTADTTVGLSTNLTLRALDPTEISKLTDHANVKEAYKLVGTASGSETQIGETIKIYKDSSLYTVYLGHTDDALTHADQSGESVDTDITYGTGHDALCFIYELANGKYKLTAVDVESFMLENEFKDGLDIVPGSYHYGEISYEPSGIDWEETGRNVTEIPANPTSTSLEYIRLQSGTAGSYTYTYYKLNSTGEVYVKLANDGGIDFKDEGMGINKSLKIKLDTTNTHYRLIDSNIGDNPSTKYAKGVMYEWFNGTNYVYTLDKDGLGTTYTTSDKETFATGGSKDNTYNLTGNSYTGYYVDNSGTYMVDTYIYTNARYDTSTTNGVGIDESMLDNKILDRTSKILKVNGESFVNNANGEIEATVTANDILVAGNESSKATSTMKIVKEVEEIPAAQDTTADFLEYNGKIYKWNSTVYEEYEINSATNMNEAIAILNHQAYYLDMGTFSINA